MIKSPKGIWYQPWSPSLLRPEIAQLVARPIMVVPFIGYGRAPVEYAKKQSTIVAGSASWVDTPYGPGMYFPNTVLASPSDYLQFRGTYPSTNAETVPHSIALLWQPRTGALAEPFCTAPNSGSRSIGIRGEPGTGFYAVHYGVVGFSGIGTVTTDHYYLQLYSYDQVAYRMLVLDLNTGAVVSTSVAETRAIATASGGPRIGIQGANESLQGVVAGVAWVRGAWTLKEMELLARDPIGIWRPDARLIRSRRITYKAPAGGAVSLVVQDVAIALNVDSPSLTQQNTLAVDDAAIALAIDNVALTQQNTLAIGDVSIAVSADNVDLVQQNVLAVNNVAVAVTAENIALDVATPLVPADTTIAVTAESTALTQQNLLAIADALLAVALEAPALVQQSILTVADSIAALALESPTLAALAGGDPLTGTRCLFSVADERTTFTVADERTTFAPNAEKVTFTPYDGVESFTPDP